MKPTKRVKKVKRICKHKDVSAVFICDCCNRLVDVYGNYITPVTPPRKE